MGQVLTAAAAAQAAGAAVAAGAGLLEGHLQHLVPDEGAVERPDGRLRLLQLAHIHKAESFTQVAGRVAHHLVARSTHERTIQEISTHKKQRRG